MGRISALTELTSLASDDYLVVLDSSANIAKKITISNAFGIPALGFTASGESWTYASATTITVPTDATIKYGKGMIVKVTQSTGGTKYGVIITVASTLLTIVWLNGATLANEAITSPAYSSNATPYGPGQLTPLSISNPYKFSAYHNTTQNSGNGAFAVMSTNTELFDTNNNFASNTYTAPVAGFYVFGARLHTTSAPTRLIVSLFKNGTEIARGTDIADDDAQQAGSGVLVNKLLQLSAGDTVDARSFGNTTLTIATATNGDSNYFFGYLMSQI